jgi:hypothetical protein
MTYDEAMHELQHAAYQAARLADSHDGAPVADIREIAAEVDSLIDHNCTRAEFKDAKALYEGAKLAGLTG